MSAAEKLANCELAALRAENERLNAVDRANEIIVDEMHKMETRITELTAALRPFAAIANARLEAQSHWTAYRAKLLPSDFRRAAAALNEGRKGET